MGDAATSQRNWLIALRAPHLGGAKLVKLQKACGGIDAVVGSGVKDLKALGLGSETIAALHRPDNSLIDQDGQWLRGPRRYLVTWGSAQYPGLLAEIPSPPAALFVEGDPDLLWQPQIAVVGSRNPTAGGLENARDFARELAARGLAITSGLASGIDSAAHQAVVEAGRNTIAVLGHGLDRIYPASSRKLFGLIGEKGALVSEFVTGVGPRKEHFPSRNRIISGLSLGVLVIEAGLKSGSLITARLGGEQGRETFALPGSIHNPMSKGCHRLIRDGTRLVETADEILQELVPLAGRLADELRQQLAINLDGAVENDSIDPQLSASGRSSNSPAEVPGGSGKFLPDPEYEKLWRCLSHDPTPIERLIERSGLTAKAVSAMLLMLELRGSVEAWPGSAYSRKKRG